MALDDIATYSTAGRKGPCRAGPADGHLPLPAQPFCILDEVDAPLDEANIGRPMRLLREMSAGTQFVIITHSKNGVTMQEPEVSRLVSVKFDAPAVSVAAAPAA